MRFAGALRFAGDVLAHFDCGFDLAARDELEVVGSEGSLFLDDPWHSREPVIEVRGADGSVERVEVERADPYACELRDFARAVAGERAPLLGPRGRGRAGAHDRRALRERRARPSRRRSERTARSLPRAEWPTADTHAPPDAISSLAGRYDPDPIDVPGGRARIRLELARTSRPGTHG